MLFYSEGSTYGPCLVGYGICFTSGSPLPQRGRQLVAFRNFKGAGCWRHGFMPGVSPSPFCFWEDGAMAKSIDRIEALLLESS